MSFVCRKCIDSFVQNLWIVIWCTNFVRIRILFCIYTEIEWKRRHINQKKKLSIRVYCFFIFVSFFFINIYVSHFYAFYICNILLLLLLVLLVLLLPKREKMLTLTAVICALVAAVCVQFSFYMFLLLLLFHCIDSFDRVSFFVIIIC